MQKNYLVFYYPDCFTLEKLWCLLKQTKFPNWVNECSWSPDHCWYQSLQNSFMCSFPSCPFAHFRVSHWPDMGMAVKNTPITFSFATDLPFDPVGNFGLLFISSSSYRKNIITYKTQWWEYIALSGQFSREQGLIPQESQPDLMQKAHSLCSIWLCTLWDKDCSGPLGTPPALETDGTTTTLLYLAQDKVWPRNFPGK